jgi:hypothetical protein
LRNFGNIWRTELETEIAMVQFTHVWKYSSFLPEKSIVRKCHVASDEDQLTKLLANEAPVVGPSNDLDHSVPNADILPPVRIDIRLEELLCAKVDLFDDPIVELTNALRQVTLDHDIKHVIMLDLGMLEGVLELLAFEGAVACAELLLGLASEPRDHRRRQEDLRALGPSRHDRDLILDRVLKSKA